ncbi:hypothetical protein [Sphingorhabdus contaminans]|uniref:Uncharacterized protein n=1 Tax=Sphingorhabdus contaminans TaxID=1343899 RepID=A0A553WGY6_9SPHN|nr:hypothetical protein [Sphingorhabdus contaminans]TSB03938.1 hypothetical protein FOM92_00365 [Sphingorhabdus contaminans]
MIADDTAIMKFEISQIAPAEYSVKWTRPSAYNISRRSFFNVGNTRIDSEARALTSSSTMLTVSFAHNGAEKRPQNFQFELRDGRRASLSLINSPFEDFTLIRTCSVADLGNWDISERYNRTVYYDSNDEVRKLFLDDQNDRKSGRLSELEIKKRDQLRISQLSKLIDDNRLKSGRDFYYAAFIFQHSETPQDYLRAHSFAMTALMRNEPDAAWIAAASLDRYLLAIGKKQIYGTQTVRAEDGAYSKAPSEDEIIPDILRSAANVPTQKELAASPSIAEPNIKH